MAIQDDWRRSGFRRTATALSLAFAAGAFGGFANWLIEPLFEALHLLDWSGSGLHPTLDRGSLFAKLATGGVWGFIFLLTLPRTFKIQQGGHDSWQFWTRAFLYGLIVAAVQIFIVLPHDGLGIGGRDLGNATPLWVTLFSTVGWSLPAYLWLYTIGPEDTEQGFGYDALAGTA